MKRKVNIVTLGCSKNLVDSEQVLGALRAHNFQVVHDGRVDSAPLAIINTCGFIRDAKEESIDTIMQFIRAKEEGLVSDVYVMGCLTERYSDELRKELVEVDEIFGARDITEVMRKVVGKQRIDLTGERVLGTPRHYAYFKVSEGCSRQCSFCAIPLIRGSHRSRDMEDLMHEAGLLAAGGVRELLLIAQDLTWYGLDNYRRRALPDLVRQLAGIPGIEWLRLHYTYPEGFPLALLDVMAEEPAVCRYLDIPVQHASDRILQSMKRGGDADSLRRLLDTIRGKVPGIALRTTLITGYPGETEREFAQLLGFVREQRFDRLGVFTYSHEEGTPAYSLKDDIPEKVKNARMEELMLVQQEISLERNKGLVGSQMKVMVDMVGEDQATGRTEFDSPEVDNEVIIATPGKDIRAGDFIDVRITGATEFDLHAVPA